MKFLKSAAALLLVMALLCSLAACGGETQPEATEPETTTAPTEAPTTEETTEPETTEAPTTTEAEPTEDETLSGLDIGTVEATPTPMRRWPCAASWTRTGTSTPRTNWHL